LKRQDLSDDPEEAGLARNWKTSERMERAGKKLKRKDCGKNEETGGFLSTSNNARRRSMYYLADNICIWGRTGKIDCRIKSINHTEFCRCQIKRSD
jgi:hypothetical protein